MDAGRQRPAAVVGLSYFLPTDIPDNRDNFWSGNSLIANGSKTNTTSYLPNRRCRP